MDLGLNSGFVRLRLGHGIEFFSGFLVASGDVQILEIRVERVRS